MQFLAEISLRRYLDTVIILPQEDRIEVGFEDLVLAVLAFKLHGQIRFLYLALVAHLIGQNRVLDELLGNGGASLLGA